MIPGGETFWRRFVTVADGADVVGALRALGVDPDAVEPAP